MQIIRIVIKGASGYGPVDEAYEDKVTLTPSSISYEYNPHPYAHSDSEGEQFIRLASFASMDELLCYTGIGNRPFHEVIMDDSTQILGQD